MRIFRDDKEAGAYDGSRVAYGIVSHLKKQMELVSVPLKTGEKFEKFIRDKDASVLFSF